VKLDNCDGRGYSSAVMTVHRETIDIRFEAYEPAEFDRWSAGDPEVVESLLSGVGDLCRDTDALRNQLGDRMHPGRAKPGASGGGYNYAEIKFANLLVTSGWPASGIVYENFRLSSCARKTGKGFRARGCASVRAAMTDGFLDAFDRLVLANPSLFAAKRAPLECTVDLFAWDPVAKRVGLWEVKRYNPKTKATEPIGTHQRAVLAFTRQIVRTVPHALVHEGTVLESGLVVFVPSAIFDTDRQWRAVGEGEQSCEFMVPA
jgi:hypothetical protein